MHEKDHASYRSPCLGAGSASLALSGCAPTGSACVGNGFSGWLQQTFGKGSSASSESTEAAAPDAGAASEAPAESADSSLPAYNADPLTGEPRRSNGRIVGVMVNNISNTQRQNARPQRGIGSADLLIESKVEGGISRFCAVYHDANAIPEVGPLRSGRDQFCSCSCRGRRCTTTTAKAPPAPSSSTCITTPA